MEVVLGCIVQVLDSGPGRVCVMLDNVSVPELADPTVWGSAINPKRLRGFILHGDSGGIQLGPPSKCTSGCLIPMIFSDAKHLYEALMSVCLSFCLSVFLSFCLSVFLCPFFENFQKQIQ